MSRLMPQTIWYLVWPNRPDPDREGKYLCRLCGKPAVSPKRFYCSDECTSLVQASVSWASARRASYMKAEGRCEFPGCGEKLKLYLGDQREGRYVAECHHIFPVKDIWKLTWDLIAEWGIPEGPRQQRVYAVVYTLLFLDVNNLVTYCPDHHKLIHSADMRKSNWVPGYNIVTLKWIQFWKLNLRLASTRSLDEFFAPSYQ